MPAFTISRTPVYPKPYLAVDLAIHRAAHHRLDHTVEHPVDGIDNFSVDLSISRHPIVIEIRKPRVPKYAVRISH